MESPQVKPIEDAIKKLQIALNKINTIDLTGLLNTRFEIRQRKISIELSSFIGALKRQLIPIQNRAEKLKAIKNHVTMLEKELNVSL